MILGSRLHARTSHKPDPPSWGPDPFSLPAKPAQPPDGGKAIPDEPARQPRQRSALKQKGLWIIAVVSATAGAGIALAGLSLSGTFPSSGISTESAVPPTTVPMTTATEIVSEPSFEAPPYLVTARTEQGADVGGVAISSEHVAFPASVAMSNPLEVVLPDGAACEGSVAGTDYLTYITVIHCPGASLTEVPAGVLGTPDNPWTAIDLALKLRSDVVPLGTDQRFVTASGIRVFGMIEIGVPLSDGTSLWSQEGDLIGLTTNSFFRDDSVTPGETLIPVIAAIPGHMLIAISHDLIRSGTVRHGMIGVETIDWTQAGSIDPSGAQVLAIVQQESVLERGDVIFLIDDHVVTSANSLVSRLRLYREGDTISLTVHRGAEQLILELQLTGISE